MAIGTGFLMHAPITGIEKINRTWRLRTARISVDSEPEGGSCAMTSCAASWKKGGLSKLDHEDQYQ
jgi:hypothetical protein